MSADQVRFGPLGRRSRSTKSDATRSPGRRTVVRRRLRGTTPEIPAAFISRSTRFRPTPIWCSRRSSAWTQPRAIGAARGGVDLLDPLDQRRIGQRAVRRRATLPVVKAGAVHPQRSAHHGHREVRPLRLDQREDLSYGSPVSRARKAAAFFRISRFIRNV
jgi:hypothetical protein